MYSIIFFILKQHIYCKILSSQMFDWPKPFKLHPTSMSYIYMVFEHLKQLWTGIWQHTHTVTTTEVSPDLGELLAEILDDVSVEMIPVRYP